MKKLALIACIAPAFAGDATPVVTPAPAAPAAPAVPCCTLEIGAGHNWASKDIIKHDVGSYKSVDTVSIDLTAVHALTPRHALTFRLAGAEGDETTRLANRYKWYLRTISIMPGYRYTAPVGEKTSVFAGVNVGAVNQRIRGKVTGAYTFSDADSAWGFGATGEVGVSYQLCPCSSVFAAYQLSGNTARNTIDGDMKNHRQIHNGVRAGVSLKF